MRVLVTGGAGFIGSHIIDGLLERGVEVAAVDDLSSGRRENVSDGAKLYETSICDAEALERIFDDFAPTHVSHQAAQASVKVSTEQPVLDASVNVLGALNVLELCRNKEVDRLVFSSTGGALYGEVAEGKLADEDWPAKPLSPYAVSKASFELYLEAYAKLHGTRSVILRYANVYGPRQDPHGEAGVVAIFAKRIIQDAPLTIYARATAGDDGCVRDYVYVGDVAAANLLALDGELDGTYNVSTGIGTTTRAVLDELAAHAGKQPKVSPSGRRFGDLERSVLSSDRLQTRGWSCSVPFQEGIGTTLRWFQSQG